MVSVIQGWLHLNLTSLSEPNRYDGGIVKIRRKFIWFGRKVDLIGRKSGLGAGILDIFFHYRWGKSLLL